ncbi:MAG TPA: 2-C-methyl-D-erythritol 4-phosphate cytidylyltransferase [Pseudonocardiaceae bacterium]|nr:2-C-methyl-D-erythritol 4-phosphate cytidylyltransferase [Pseudonocardiaceae bacterium]
MTVVALVPTGRTGQFGDISLLEPALRNLLASDCIDLVALVTASSDVDEIKNALTGPPIQVIGIEQTAFESTNSMIAAALPAISISGSSAISAVLVHPPRHAYAPPELVRRVVDEVRAGAVAVVPVLPCTDTVKELDSSGVIIDTPDRTTLRVTQSPIGFAASLWSGEEPGTWRRLPPGARTIAGHPAARAIRTAFDLVFAKDSA